MRRILVVDDDNTLREMVALALEKSGFTAVRASSAGEARKVLRADRPDLVICDIYMPGGDGLSFLREVQETEDPPPVILMTARGSVETASVAARIGAFDYLAKPFDVSILVERVRAALVSRPLPTATPVEGPASMIVGSHPGIVEVYKAVARVAPLRVPVLVFGETGTGKELIARALHRFGGKPEGPFVVVHCGAIPDSLLESELFGHRRGAFTDAVRDRRGALPAAHGGTIFLDEIGEISAAFQVKLLRVLEDGVVTPLGAEKAEAVDVRAVAATNRDLREMVTAGRFRQDLYYRLAGYEIRIPPLRERLSDLPALVEHFQRRAEKDLGLASTSGPTSGVLERLGAHPWPGNVRELAHIVRRLMIDTGALDDEATLERLLRQEGHETIAQGSASLTLAEPQPTPPPRTLDEAERRHILAVLESTGGNKSEAARILGIERKTLARKLKRSPATGPERTGGEEP
jgi:DNA-binding NtrC family response regulator